MEKETIKENNKLIGEFMGDIFKTNFTVGSDLVPEGWLRKLNNMHYGNLKYHSSWDWLMPVVEKCYSMDEYFKYKEETERQFYPSGIELSTKIESVWFACVEFIKWYNANGLN